MTKLQWGALTPACCPQLHLPNPGSAPAGRARENKRPWDVVRGPRATPQKRREGLPGPEIPGGEARSPRVSPDLRRSEPGAARSATRVHLLPQEASQVTPRAPSGAPCPVWKDWSAFRRCSDCFRGGCNALRRGQQVMQKPSGQGPVCNTLQLPQLVNR